MEKLQRELQELREKLILKIITREQYYRELDDMIKNAKNKEEIKVINQWKYDG